MLHFLLKYYIFNVEQNFCFKPHKPHEQLFIVEKDFWRYNTNHKLAKIKAHILKI